MFQKWSESNHNYSSNKKWFLFKIAICLKVWPDWTIEENINVHGHPLVTYIYTSISQWHCLNVWLDFCSVYYSKWKMRHLKSYIKSRVQTLHIECSSSNQFSNRFQKVFILKDLIIYWPYLDKRLYCKVVFHKIIEKKLIANDKNEIQFFEEKS